MRLQFYCLFLCAVIGAVVLGLEVLAARAMAPLIGAGPVAWACLLAVALGTLAAGNLLGGYLAGRVRLATVIMLSFAVSAAFLMGLSVFYRPVIEELSRLALLPAALLSSFVTQAISMFLLGVNTPLILQVETRADRKGIWQGAVLACGSAGGIAGALLVGILLVPAFGLSRTFLLLAGILLVAGIPIAIHGRRRPALSVMTVLFAVGLACSLVASEPGIVQSRHGQLELRTTRQGAALLIDGIQQTALGRRIEKWVALEEGYLLEAAIRRKPDIRSALVIGLGAGLAPRILREHGIECECVEIDPAVVEIARRPFGFGGTVTVADGRQFLRETDRQWDLIFLDVCTSDRLPWHMFTAEAFDIARRSLSPDGILAVQFIGDGGAWSGSVLETARSVFKDAVLFGTGPEQDHVGLYWVFAANDLAELRAKHKGWTKGTARMSADIWDNQSATGAVMTDDHFPAESAWARTALAWRRKCLATFH